MAVDDSGNELVHQPATYVANQIPADQSQEIEAGFSERINTANMYAEEPYIEFPVLASATEAAQGLETTMVTRSNRSVRFIRKIHTTSYTDGTTTGPAAANKPIVLTENTRETENNQDSYTSVLHTEIVSN